MNRIFFLFATPPLSTYTHRYCIGDFEKKGWETHIIDLSYIINPIAYKTVKNGLVDDKKREIFTTKKAFRQYVKDAGEGAVFILTMDFYYDTYFVHKAIRKNQIYGYLNRIDTNVEVAPESSAKRIIDLVKKFTFQRLRNSSFIRIPRKCFKIKPADFVILGGMANEQEYINLCFTDESTVIQHIHSLDYEKCLEVCEKDIEIVKEPYCVFLDQFIPYHPDNISRGYCIDGERYYKELNCFFHNIQDNMNVKVVIAAHPRSDYESKESLLSDFTVVKFKTAELVKNSEFVIAHFTTSISYAVTFQKPMVLITNNDMNGISLFKQTIEKISHMLELEILNLSDNEKFKIPKLQINEKKYNEYKNEYLKPLSEKDDNIRFGDKFYTLLKNLLLI